MKDYYKVLGIKRTSSLEQIKKAYKNLAMKYHPDRNPNSVEKSTAKLQEINEAYSVIGNSSKRSEYNVIYDNLFKDTSNNQKDTTQDSSTRNTDSEQKSKTSAKTNKPNNTTKEEGFKFPKFDYKLIVLVMVFLFLAFKIFSLTSSISILKDKLSTIESKLLTLENSETIFVYASYFGEGNILNNVDRIGNRSLSLPKEAKGKNCVIVGSKMDGSNGGTVRQYLGKDLGTNTYNFAENYEANVNFTEQKIEITKRNGYTSQNLSDSERDSLYFSTTLLCK